ncbi:MAG TPA: hypothetical protein DEP07_13520 [Brevibacillus sp.]|nr:hypothetical protein [Brevibacillus sp.]
MKTLFSQNNWHLAGSLESPSPASKKGKPRQKQMAYGSEIKLLLKGVFSFFCSDWVGVRKLCR